MYSNIGVSFHETVPLSKHKNCIPRFVFMSSVSDPDTFFTDPDPGKKLILFKGNKKNFEKFLFSTKKVGTGILLSRELLYTVE